MKKLFTFFSSANLSKKASVLCSFALLFFYSNNAISQVITEGFEESGWSVTGVASSTTVTVTETYGTAGTWAYKSNSVVTAAAAPAAQAHTGSRALAHTSSSSSYLITPLITSGVSQVKVWVYANGTSSTVVIGAATNTTVTANTGSISSTGGGAWSLASSTFGTANGLAVGAWKEVTFDIPASVTSNFTNPAYVKIQRTANNFQIDDIVITSPVSITPPTVTTNDPVATSITESSATLGGNITDMGAGTITTSGFCYGLTANPTITGTKTTDGPTAVGAITSSITGLVFSTTYHVRAYATGSAGTVYGADVTFTTSAPSTPTVIISPASLAFGSVLLSTTSGEKTFTVSGAGLTPGADNITVTAPAGYEVSATSGSGFSSSINIPYTGGALASTTVFVHFMPTALVSYNGNIDVTGGGATAQTVAVTGAGTDIAYSTGDYKSVASGNWNVTATWNKWDGSAWVASTDFPNLQTANVYIVDGFTVNAEASGRRVANLYVDGNSILKSSNKVNSPLYIKVFGSTVSVKPGSLIGNLLTGNDADGICIDDSSANLTITGGGTINLSRLRTNVANTILTIDNDVTLNYHGSGNAGNAAGLYTVAGDDNTITINAGKTLTFAPWSCYTPIATSHSNGGSNQTININGTVTFVDGLVPGNATANGWSGHTNGYMSMGVTAKTFTLNIGGTGKLNVSEFYPNGTKADNSAGTGDLVNINIAAGGVMNVSKIADLRKATQTVIGAGTINILAGAKLKIGSTDGITASSALGNIQTTGRSYSNAATYAYEGTAAQVSGDGLPSTVSGLIIKNKTGLTLTGSTQTTDSLCLTDGLITTGSSNMLTVGSASLTIGGHDTAHVNGPLTKLTAGTTSYSFPVGKGGKYRPASVTPAAADASSYTAEYFNTSGASTSSLGSSLTSVGTNEYWDIARNSGSDALVSLNYDNTITTTWSNGGVADILSDITVAHLVGGTWVDEAGATGTVIAGNSTTGTVVSQALNSFSPFTFGLKPSFGTPVKLVTFNATKLNGQTKLYWSTNNELNVNAYTVEKSIDGKNFSVAGNVQAMNNLKNDYSFVDVASAGGVTYYRIRINEKTGASSFSNVIAVNNKKLTGLNIFPNPVLDNIYITHNRANAGAKLEVYGMDGRKMAEHSVTKDAIQSTINASMLVKGNYNLVYVNGTDIQYIRFVKQ